MNSKIDLISKLNNILITRVYIKFILLGIISILFINYCKFVEIGAAADSTITISATPVNIASGESSSIKVSGYNSDGSPLRNGTIVQLSTNLGKVDNKISISDGVAFATFVSKEDESGKAVITARSGSVEEKTVTINVGAAALFKLYISANPQSLPEGGGTSHIIVNAFDINSKPLESVPIIIKASAGNLQKGGIMQYTDVNGQVFDTLSTYVDATVTAESPATSDNSSETKEVVETKVLVESQNKIEANFTFTPVNPNIGTRVSFNGSSSTAGSGNIEAYEWDFGDGFTGSGIQTYHNYKENGDYTIRLLIKNSLGTTAFKDNLIKVTDPLSQLIISANPQSLPEGGGESEITVSLFDHSQKPLSGVAIIIKTSAGNLLSGGGIQYTNINGQLIDRVSTIIDTTVTAETLASTGSTEIQKVETKIDVESKNSTEARFTYYPGAPNIGTEITFNASTSTSGTGIIERYDWDFGDGINKEGKKVFHTYTENGDFKVSLLITNSVGTTAYVEKTVKVSVLLSQIIITAKPQYLPVEGGDSEISVIAFDTDQKPLSGVGIIIKTDKGDLIKEGKIQYTDINGQVFDTLSTVEDANVSAETLIAGDGTSKSDRVSITVEKSDNLFASFVFSPQNPKTGDSIYFNASASEGLIEKYEWDFGDGKTGSGKKIYHTYSTSGTYSVQLVIKDNSGKSHNTNKSITVTD